MVYGSSIDDAATDNGKPYSELPNAFRYRNETRLGLHLQRQGPVGLASVNIENDPTLRKGDIVAGENGLVVAGRSADKRGAALNFSPASDASRRATSACPWWRGNDAIVMARDWSRPSSQQERDARFSMPSISSIWTKG